MRRELLLLDGVGNVVLGLLLLAAPLRVTAWLGLSVSGSAFYATLFGAVLVGIGIALLLERRAKEGVTRGLGLTGALVINLCFGLALAAGETRAYEEADDSVAALLRRLAGANR